uniref:hypothetical protein n=1 Tax=Nitzschia ovalis TaxID=908985 RepID=UPI001EF9EA52|nr:hypothetical protein MKT70_pgp104 [Nitzschia ovalis]ULD15695.1 hypothetical protein [Nitzschia ovalis]
MYFIKKNYGGNEMKKLKARLTNLKTKVNLFRKKKIASSKLFIKKIREKKADLPKSKLKRYAYGMATSLGIIGLVFLSGPLVAFAKDLPADAKPKKPANVSPAPAPLNPAAVKALSGAASSICGLAISSGSFVLGALCGAVVGVGILVAQGKMKISGK